LTFDRADRFERVPISAASPAVREAELYGVIESLRRELRAAQSARKQALVVAQARGDFVATTSHELRTPLNAIIGFSEVLKAEMFGPLGNERYREYADIIHRSGKGLLGLINDLLDMSKLDAGKLEMHFAPVEVLKVIVECVRGVEAMANKSRVGITVNVFDGIDSLEADGKRLRQMLLNLLSNAVKFTHEGGEVCISAFRRGDSVAIAVSDTGIGMTDDDIPKVLEPFGQIESDLSGKHDGTGLGLPLTKELAERHGGSLSIESAVGVGTTITILLPGDPASACALM
jgi:two-component system cell cycle sensor histidine kinase PleC